MWGCRKEGWYKHFWKLQFNKTIYQEKEQNNIGLIAFYGFNGCFLQSMVE